MVWANRHEPARPTLPFDDLNGWTIHVDNGAEASLASTRVQNIWERPVARLRYRGDGKPNSQPIIRIIPAKPVELPNASDSIDMWVYGNRWDWVNPPGTPPVRIQLHISSANGGDYVVAVDSIRWEEWWLMHRRLPAGIKFPAFLQSIEVVGGRQSEWREIFFDSIRFYKEATSPLRFAPRPARNLTLFAGQSVGGNTGPGRLPFPTHEETILPMQMGGAYHNSVVQDGGRYEFTYVGKDARIRYQFDPRNGLSGITADLDGAPVGTLLDGGKLKTTDDAGMVFRSAKLEGQQLVAEYEAGTTLKLSIRQKSLILDVANSGGLAAEISFGAITHVIDPRIIYVPPITYGGTNPCVLLCKAGLKGKDAFVSIWPDWYRSNGSELIGAEEASGGTARINGSILYHLRTDGVRNPLFERIFLTVTPRFEEALPVVPNPVGLHAKEAVDRLWQETWGPENYAAQMKRSEVIRSYGIDKLIQCNHEITWRDAGESFTLRTHAAPKKGGDEALQNYIAHQLGLGWNSGLYSNYTDFIPVNEHWTPDGVQRLSDGEWRSAWPRCWAEKPMKAVEFDAALAPEIKKRFHTNSAYTDVSTAVSPWGYTDFDARVPGAGTFAQTFYCHGELLRNDSRVYGGPIFSEGTYQWLYAGLADGNYGHTYNGRSLATQPLLPVFDLYQIHSKECDIGVSWTSFFCDAIPNWQAPDNIDRAIDRFLLTTLAYGHIGWLVEEEHGIGRTCRSYYMLQQVQRRYGLKQPSRIAYWDGAQMRSVSDAISMKLPASRRQIYIEYPGGLRLWLNDHPTDEWRVQAGEHRIDLPPSGWAAVVLNENVGARDAKDSLFSYSALNDSGRVDYLRSAAYTYQDGRGKWFATTEAGSSGALAISKPRQNRLRVIRIGGDGEFMIRRPYGVVGAVVGCQAYGTDGKLTPSPVLHDSGSETWIEPVKDANRYELMFSGASAWTVTTAEGQAAPGSHVILHVNTNHPVEWDSRLVHVVNGGLPAIDIPETAVVGSLIRAKGRTNGQQLEAAVRVCAPVELASFSFYQGSCWLPNFRAPDASCFTSSFHEQ